MLLKSKYLQWKHHHRPVRSHSGVLWRRSWSLWRGEKKSQWSKQICRLICKTYISQVTTYLLQLQQNVITFWSICFWMKPSPSCHLSKLEKRHNYCFSHNHHHRTKFILILFEYLHFQFNVPSAKSSRAFRTPLSKALASAGLWKDRPHFLSSTFQWWNVGIAMV